MDGGVELTFAHPYPKSLQDNLATRHEYALFARDFSSSIRYPRSAGLTLLGDAPTFAPIRPAPIHSASRQSPAREPSMDVAADSHAVIDLTADDSDPVEIPEVDIIGTFPARPSRPPNSTREIIDVDSLPDRPNLPSPILIPDSSDLEVTFARTVPHGLSTGNISAPPAQPVEPPLSYWQTWARGPLPAPMRMANRSQNPTLPAPSRSYMTTFLTQRIGISSQFRTNEWDPSHAEGSARSPIEQATTRRPITSVQNPAWVREQARASAVQALANVAADYPRPQMDYSATALSGGPAAPKPPTPAHKGFTRSPNEDDELVCPNCDEELGVGSTEQKRAVYYAKGCGHVYCGECVNNRPRKVKVDAMRKPTGPPLSDCKVCKAGVPAKKDTRQIYL